MNIVDRVAVCSRSFSNNQHLRQELLQRYQNVTFNDEGLKLSGDTLIEFIQGHDKAITALETVDEFVLSKLPQLKIISKYGVGLDMIDMQAMDKFGVKLGWTAGVNKRSVSELVIAFAIALLRHVPTGNDLVRSGGWKQLIGAQLTGSTFGIIGCGNVGRDLVKLLQPFNCKILVNDIIDQPEFYASNNIKPVEIEELLSDADIVSMHVPLDGSTKDLLNMEKLSLLRPSALLINVARGGMVDEQALKEMLKSKQLAAAAFDVFAQEPPCDTELLNLSNFLATPHIGGSSAEAILAMGRAAIHGLDDPGIHQQRELI